MDATPSSNNSDGPSRTIDPGKIKRKKEKHSKKKHKRSSSSSSRSSSSSSHRKHKKKHKKTKKKKKHASPQPVIPSAPSATGPPGGPSATALVSDASEGPTPKPKGPMTKEQWDAQQSVVRRVYDPDTQRMRLVKGDGEIIEEIVSRERHLAINKNATKADGATFQANLGLNKR